MIKFKKDTTSDLKCCPPSEPDILRPLVQIIRYSFPIPGNSTVFAGPAVPLPNDPLTTVRLLVYNTNAFSVTATITIWQGCAIIDNLIAALNTTIDASDPAMFVQIEPVDVSKTVVELDFTTTNTPHRQCITVSGHITLT